MQSSSRIGLILKISVILFILLAIVVYKLNDYFKNERANSAQMNLHNKTVLLRTSVSSQLAQLKNLLSSYSGGVYGVDVNWSQLDPFIMVMKLENYNGKTKVDEFQARQGTTAEKWDRPFLEKAVAVNESKLKSSVLAQMFSDKQGSKYILLRFKTSKNNDVAVIGEAPYFQKFFDLDRGSIFTTLLTTEEGMLVGHSESDYLASFSDEYKLSTKKYLVEKEELPGSNLTAVSYVLKSKLVGAFAIPFSILGVIAGIGFILLGVLFYILDPLERKIDKYKKQERAQAYKDTLDEVSHDLKKSVVINEARQQASAEITKQEDNYELKIPKAVEQQEDLKFDSAEIMTAVENKATVAPPKDFYAIDKQISEDPPEVVVEEKTNSSLNQFNLQTETINVDEEIFKIKEENYFNSDKIAESDIDISDIEKALSIDDLDLESSVDNETAARLLENELKPKKTGVEPELASFEKPNISLQKKKLDSDDFKVEIRPAKKV